ncbi:DUF3060 domain-containing protein [uncultured Mycolicibacterium sp.]|uniref:DUF3060 domain-containing protein n=1 Tax=uncultured Mycolicibacterium sp. TaxID=2320817 RepID=UPI00260AC93B|nr:DUF3060 domain-containing protein [uncultured Mycolicibacterium sp.]
MRLRPAASTVAVAAVVAGLAGCGSGDRDGAAPTMTAGTSGAQIEVGNTINYGSFGTTAELDCADGKSLNVGGSNNTLTVRGRCANVNIGGADNRITLDRVEHTLTVVGLNNIVSYRAGDPQVDDLGSGNRIDKG